MSINDPEELDDQEEEIEKQPLEQLTIKVDAAQRLMEQRGLTEDVAIMGKLKDRIERWLLTARKGESALQEKHLNYLEPPHGGIGLFNSYLASNGEKIPQHVMTIDYKTDESGGIVIDDGGDGVGVFNSGEQLQKLKEKGAAEGEPINFTLSEEAKRIILTEFGVFEDEEQDGELYDTIGRKYLEGITSPDARDAVNRKQLSGQLDAQFGTNIPGVSLNIERQPALPSTGNVPRESTKLYFDNQFLLKMLERV